MQRPIGVTIIATLCFLSAAYICVLGVLVGSATISMARGTQSWRPLDFG